MSLECEPRTPAWRGSDLPLTQACGAGRAGAGEQGNGAFGRKHKHTNEKLVQREFPGYMNGVYLSAAATSTTTVRGQGKTRLSVTYRSLPPSGKEC